MGSDDLKTGATSLGVPWSLGRLGLLLRMLGTAFGGGGCVREAWRISEWERSISSSLSRRASSSRP